MQASNPNILPRIAAQRMDDHIDEAKAYVKGLENIQKNLKNGANQEMSETRYADKVVDF